MANVLDELLERGYIKQFTHEEETRKFDSATNTTVLMRKKETGNDYRYFPEPDIPYLEIFDDVISSVKASIVLLPDERRKIYLERNILPINVEKLICLISPFDIV